MTTSHGAAALGILLALGLSCAPAQAPSLSAACLDALDELAAVDVRVGSAIIKSGACDHADTVMQCAAYAEHRARFDGLAAAMTACSAVDR